MNATTANQDAMAGFSARTGSPARMVEEIAAHLNQPIAEVHRKVSELTATLGLSYADAAESVWWQIKKQKREPENDQAHAPRT